MTIKKDIIKLLTEKELTSTGVSTELNIPKNRIWVYLKTLLNENRIERITDKKPYIYKATNNYHDETEQRALHGEIRKLEKTLNILREMFEGGVVKVYREKMNKKYVEILEAL